MSAPTGLPQRVVVGLGPTVRAPGALGWAVDLVAATGGHLLVLRAWRPLPTGAGSRGAPTGVGVDPGAAELAAAAQLDADVASVLGRDHAAETRLVRGGRRRVMLEQSEHADLLVLDAPSALRSSSPGLLARLAVSAACPVVVVPRVQDA